MNNQLIVLVLKALQRADGYSLPESTLVDGITNMVKPPATSDDFRDVFTRILQRELAGFTNDPATDERMFFLMEKGTNYLRSV